VKEESPCGCRANEERKTEKLCYSPVLNIHYFKLLLSSFQDCSRCQGAGFPTFALFLVRKLFLKTSNSNFLCQVTRFAILPNVMRIQTHIKHMQQGPRPRRWDML